MGTEKERLSPLSSPKQIKANQENSLKSTGPKTKEGKTTSAKNALKHGLMSNQVVLPWESAVDLQELRDRMYASISPSGELEELLFDRIVSLTWRLKRAGRIETGIFSWETYNTNYRDAQKELMSYEKMVPFINLKLREDTLEIIDPEAHALAKQRAAESRAQANTEIPILGRSFVNQSNSLALLHRYETGLEKSLFKALHELQRLQASRSGQSVPVPLAIDVQLDGDREIT